MLCLVLSICLVPLSASALSSLPAPFNLSVNSVNFRHVLHWTPGPGTPPGAHYTVFKRTYGGNEQQQLNSTTTSAKLQLENNVMYHLTVKAHYNHSVSPMSKKSTFCPFTDTKIGPPTVSLVGCGNCIQVNISLPEADPSSMIDDIWKYYNAHFKVFCKKGDKIVGSYSTKSKTFTIDNLNVGEEYCVEVDTEISINKNTLPSPMKCIFTGAAEQRTAPALLVAVAALVVFMVIALISIVFCLHYTGFLCNPEALPTVLKNVGQGIIRIMTPEQVAPDPVTIVPLTDNRNMPREPTVPRHVIRNEDEDEEEEEADDAQMNYLDRDAPSSTGESLPFDSGHSENKEPAGCGGLNERSPAEAEVSDRPGAGDEDEVEAEEAILSKEGHVRIQGHGSGGEETEEEHTRKEMVFDNSGNVDLFSVTLVALSLGGEGGEEQRAEEPLSDSSEPLDLEPLLAVQKWTDTDSQSGDPSVVGLMRHNYEDFRETGTEGLRCNTSCYIRMQHGEEHEEEEEEEDNDRIFQYMAHT